MSPSIFDIRNKVLFHTDAKKLMCFYRKLIAYNSHHQTLRTPRYIITRRIMNAVGFYINMRADEQINIETGQ